MAACRPILAVRTTCKWVWAEGSKWVWAEGSSKWAWAEELAGLGVAHRAVGIDHRTILWNLNQHRKEFWVVLMVIEIHRTVLEYWSV